MFFGGSHLVEVVHLLAVGEPGFQVGRALDDEGLVVGEERGEAAGEDLAQLHTQLGVTQLLLLLR